MLVDGFVAVLRGMLVDMAGVPGDRAIDGVWGPVC